MQQKHFTDTKSVEVKRKFKKKFKSDSVIYPPYRTVLYRFPLQFLSRSRSLGVKRWFFSAFNLKARTVPYLELKGRFSVKFLFKRYNGMVDQNNLQNPISMSIT
jgi:hypothetical protein